MIINTLQNLKPAPIALFVYNRLSQTTKTVEALKNNLLASESELYIFSDAPKSEADFSLVAAVRYYINKISGFKKITIINREANFGLSKSIIDGVTRLANEFGRVIVLEDDLVTSHYFLQFMNEALNIYKDDEKVISVHGYLIPVKEKLPEAFFLRGAECWGWATWKRGWDLIELDGKKLLGEIKKRKLDKKFDLDGGYPYTQMLVDQIEGWNNSWAIRWLASAFLKDKLTLYPGRSLVKNIGFDNSGVHSGSTDILDTEVSLTPIILNRILPVEVEAHRKIIVNFYKSPKLKVIIFLMKMKNKLKKFITKPKFKRSY